MEAGGSADEGNDRGVVLGLDRMATHSGQFTTWHLLIPGYAKHSDRLGCGPHGLVICKFFRLVVSLI